MPREERKAGFDFDGPWRSRKSVMAFSIIVPSMVNWMDLKKVVVKKIHSIPRESLSLSFFLPFSVMYVSACTTNTSTNETCAHRGAPEKGATPPSSILERSFLRSGGLKVVVASGREKRAPGLDLSSVPMRGFARYRPARHARSSRAVSCRESAVSNARIGR